MSSMHQSHHYQPLIRAATIGWDPLIDRFPSIDCALSRPTEDRLETRLMQASRLLSDVIPSLSGVAKGDTLAAIDAMERLANGDRSGVTDQYFRVANSPLDSADSQAAEPHLFFCVWQRTENDPPTPCLVFGDLSRRNKALLKVTRSNRFVTRVANRLRATNIPGNLLGSRVQSFDIHASAGSSPAVLFSDFVLMDVPPDLTASSCGGIVFNSFGDTLFDQMDRFAVVFCGLGDWLKDRGVMSKESMRVLAAAHVQAHDLCGHSLPFDLHHPTRLKVDWDLRAPLEEMYADTQAMWIYGAPETRELLREVLTEGEMDAAPATIAVKRMSHYARLDATDHDARCSWMMYEYWRRQGLFENSANGTSRFDVDRLHAATEALLDRLLVVEHAIGDGEVAYERACTEFTAEFSAVDPNTGAVSMPQDLKEILNRIDAVEAA